MSKRPYESILPYLDQIEEGLKKNQSPQAIAGALGIPEKYRTIYRYKKDHFDLQKEAGEEWSEEIQKAHDQRKSEGKAEIIQNFELLNLRKMRARELLLINIGDETQTKNGTTKISQGYAATLWGQGDKIADNAIRQELEMMGDDPESRKASALESLSEDELDARLNELLAILNETSSGKDGRGEALPPGAG